ncbi:helix-turn-helix transcriptional regulator [Haloterrigena sp. SYSU A558-1]|uniref:Transcriptional regulator n=2 Tax=Haloterrigena TaxID=121871 RepID=D2S3N5_HALTV|nr:MULTISPECIES: helix-turn-helix domain-containing protein [Haloterrigena]ADB63982.1 putative transcriptional regulator [Haloterrigena turkmenica DSM 5511]NUC74970.1 helix-turn-helix transcriptional regulator [Haloterrigena gelatinilytica]
MPPDRQRDETSGRFDSEYTSNRFLEAVRRLGPTTTGEVSNELDCHRNTARRRLKELEEQGRIEKEEIGQEFVWRAN